MAVIIYVSSPNGCALPIYVGCNTRRRITNDSSIRLHSYMSINITCLLIAREELLFQFVNGFGKLGYKFFLLSKLRIIHQ